MHCIHCLVDSLPLFQFLYITKNVWKRCATLDSGCTCIIQRSFYLFLYSSVFLSFSLSLSLYIYISFSNSVCLPSLSHSFFKSTIFCKRYATMDNVCLHFKEELLSLFLYLPVFLSSCLSLSLFSFSNSVCLPSLSHFF